MCNPIENLCDDIASHVRDRERALIERLTKSLHEMLDNENDEWLKSYVVAVEVLKDADAWLAEPVKVEIDAAYGEAK